MKNVVSHSFGTRSYNKRFEDTTNSEIQTYLMFIAQKKRTLRHGLFLFLFSRFGVNGQFPYSKFNTGKLFESKFFNEKFDRMGNNFSFEQYFRIYLKNSGKSVPSHGNENDDNTQSLHLIKRYSEWSFAVLPDTLHFVGKC